MGNPLKGEIAFEAGGRTRRLQYSADAICAMEGELDMGVVSIAQKLQDPDPRFGFIRVVFWAGLREHDPDVTVKEAGELILEMTLTGALETIGRAFQAAFGKPEGGAGAKGPRQARPKSRAGTSKTSSARGAS